MPFFFPLESYLNDCFFSFRRRYSGQLKLRLGLPRVELSHSILQEQAFYSLLLSKASPSIGDPASFSSVVDVGCRNWSYVSALSEFFPHASFLGVELDGGRRYWNLYRRQDYARAFTQKLCESGRGAQCFFGDFRHLDTHGIAPPRNQCPSDEGNSLLFTFFYPFVSENPCLKWGLPSRYADFSSLLEHALNLGHTLKRRTMILSAHQGEWEFEIAKKAYQEALKKQPGQNPFYLNSTVIRASEFQGLWPAPYDVYLLSLT